jgi:hypothetical protein
LGLSTDFDPAGAARDTAGALVAEPNFDEEGDAAFPLRSGTGYFSNMTAARTA